MIAWILVGLLLVVANLNGAAAIVFRYRWLSEEASHQREHAATKKVGKWYQERTEALEQESAILAAQLVQAGAQPVRTAMPLYPPEDHAQYAFDSTGIVVSRLDPRDMPMGSDAL